MQESLNPLRGSSKSTQESLNPMHGSSKSIFSVGYGKADGVESTFCNGVAKPAAWKTKDGRLWFPTTKGLIVVAPNVRVNQMPPPVFIEQIIADKKNLLPSQVVIQSPDVGGEDGPASEPTFEAPPGRGELEFRYTALNFQTPEKCRFKYQLESIDSEWVEADTRRVAHYNNLLPGSYRFKVIACNEDGIWNEAGTTTTVILDPHPWQTWWFRGLAVAGVTGALATAVRYATRRRMQRKLEILEQQHALERERGRIAKDIHDDLGSSLTRIMMLGERAQDDIERRDEAQVHVRKIVDSARATVQSLDEIVWAVNPENDTLDGLVEYISHYADQFFESTNVKCRLEMPVELSPLPLPAEARHDLFLVVKEALNNILKHSGATEARICVAEIGATVEIVIEDNGRGFELNETNAGRKRNGLENMRRRIEGLGGTFGVTSAPGRGTKLTVTARLDLKHVA
jgi:signal transduction histidine kinase